MNLDKRIAFALEEVRPVRETAADKMVRGGADQQPTDGLLRPRPIDPRRPRA